MTTDDADIAANYVLGLYRGEQREAVAEKLSAEPSLRARADLWEAKFVALDLSGREERPDADLFDHILAAVDASDRPQDALYPDVIPGTLTRRAGGGKWTELSPGVERQILFDDPIARRRSMLIRMAPGALYLSHPHDGGFEECLVLEGEVAFGDCRLAAGDFHVAMAGSIHPGAISASGCLLHISAPF